VESIGLLRLEDVYSRMHATPGDRPWVSPGFCWPSYSICGAWRSLQA
jgi:hypothetical protein